MIKYFSYERYYDDNIRDYITKNEMILYEKPQTYEYGWKTINIENGYKYIIDVEKYINFSGKLSIYRQNIYDKLMLVEVRNKKLDTL